MSKRSELLTLAKDGLTITVAWTDVLAISYDTTKPQPEILFKLSGVDAALYKHSTEQEYENLLDQWQEWQVRQRIGASDA